MVVIGNGLVAVWALVASRLPALQRRALWWCTGGAHIAVIAEVALGVAVVSGQDREAPQIHSFYGFLAIVAVAILHSYRNALRHRLHLLYGVGGLFVMGLGIRAMVLGPTG